MAHPGFKCTECDWEHFSAITADRHEQKSGHTVEEINPPEPEEVITPEHQVVYAAAHGGARHPALPKEDTSVDAQQITAENVARLIQPGSMTDAQAVDGKLVLNVRPPHTSRVIVVTATIHTIEEI